MKNTISSLGISPPKLWESSEHGGLQEGNRSGINKLLESADLKTKLPLEITSLPLSQKNLREYIPSQSQNIMNLRVIAKFRKSSELNSINLQKCLKSKQKHILFVVFGIFLRIKRKETRHIFAFSIFWGFKKKERTKSYFCDFRVFEVQTKRKERNNNVFGFSSVLDQRKR